jgi:hypothetical protein
MSPAAILIVAIAVSGILMMRFRKRWLAKINITFTNRITSLFAGWMVGFGILTHLGRKSGKVYRTPVNVSSAERFRHRAHLQQPIRVGEEPPSDRWVRTENWREAISAFLADCRA